MNPNIYFQISGTDFLEATKIHGVHDLYGIRIVSYSDGREKFIYLPEVNLHGLSLLASVLRLLLLQSVYDINDLRRYARGGVYYY